MTSVPESLRDDQSERMRRYLVSMSIRTVCFLLAVFTGGVLRWTFVAAAVVLPYIAVVMANAARSRTTAAPARPVTPQHAELPPPDSTPRDDAGS